MYPRFAFALLFSVCAFGLGIAIPAYPECPENEVFKPCGSACAPTCANPKPSPVCTRQCVIGCFCKPGYLRNKYHVCVPADKCDAPTLENNMLFAYPPEVSQCKENEMFMPCGSACAPTCAKPHPGPACTMQCVVGCFCKPGYLKNDQGVCVPSEQCGVPASEAMPMQAPVCVGENEEYRQCKGCDGTCKNPNPLCPRICIPGCACKKGHVRDSANGKCIKVEQCPKVNPASFMMMPPVCKENEVFKTCGTACPATCSNPHPSAVCTKNCVIGCFCKEGHLKNANGMCVPAANCEMPAVESATRPYGDDILCPTDREVYIDDGKAAEYNCVASCDTPLPYMIRGEVQIPKKCKDVKAAPGCICRFPYVRNEDGKCVERQECPKTTMPPMTTTH